MILSPARPARLTLPVETTTCDRNNPSSLSLTSPTNPNRRPNKRKKGFRNSWRVVKKLETLTENLKPIPFIPTKTLDFDKHEEVLRRLGLWDFVHIEFDRNVKVDLLAQLVVYYDSRKRCSYVNEYRIQVNRPDFGRSLKLPAVKLEKGGGVEEVDLDSEAYTEESLSFLEEFVSSWVLLHEDTWKMQQEVLTWTQYIKDGHPEKVDWAGLIWYMVEKELAKGDKLGDCYYASHLQYLIKSQREELFVEEPKVELEVEVKEEDVGCDANVKGEDNVSVEEPNIELTLGQDVVEQEEVNDDEMMNIEERKEKQQGNWPLDGKNNVSEHFLQRCPLGIGSDLDSYEKSKEEEDLNGFDEGNQEEVEVGDEEEEELEEERDEGFDIEANDDSLDEDRMTGNLLQVMETTQIPFTSQGELHRLPSLDLLASRDGTYLMSGGPSFFGSGSKRAIELEHDVSHHSFNGNNKRLRTEEMWEQKPSDFMMCMDEMQQWITKAKMIYESQEQTYENSHVQQQYLFEELQRRQTVIELLQKSKDEELGKKNAEIFRLERELYLMRDLVVGYRNALKETEKVFSKYRERCPMPEEPLSKVAGPGGLVLSTRELENRRVKQEEDDKMKLLSVQHIIETFEEEWIGKLQIHLEKVLMLDSKLVYYENEVKRLQELSAQLRVQKFQDALPQNGTGLQNLSSVASELQDAPEGSSLKN